MASRPDVPGRGEGLGEPASGPGAERAFAIVVGAALIALGLAGSMGNPIVGRAGSTSLLLTGPGHDIVHLVIGALYLHVGMLLNGRQRANGLLGLGVLIFTTGLLSLLSADLFGLYGTPTSGLDQLGHLTLGAASVVLAWLGRDGRARAGRSRAARTRRMSRS